MEAYNVKPFEFLGTQFSVKGDRWRFLDVPSLVFLENVYASLADKLSNCTEQQKLKHPHH